MQNVKTEQEKSKEEPKPDTSDPTGNGSYTIPAQMH